MSNPRLPAEILDHVVEHLHDAKHALRNCCLVSKSWIPRTRQHLFADINLKTRERLKWWKEKFPDPSTSPGYYTRTLSISLFITAADAEVGGWIRGFSRVVRLVVGGDGFLPGASTISLTPFHGFSPIKSLYVNTLVVPSSQVFDFILSFPLLEDLTIRSCAMPIDNDDLSDGSSTAVPPPNLPVFSGVLNLSMVRGTSYIAHGLLSLPDGIRFRELGLTWTKEGDVSLTTALVKSCSRTLEFLDVTCKPRFEPSPGSTSIDLSKAAGLGAAVFRVDSWHVEWVTKTLQTIPLEHQALRQISIHAPYHLTNAGTNVMWTIGEQIFRQWLDLDRLLVQLWEARSIRPKLVAVTPHKEKQDVRDCVRCLLPEMTTRGIIDLVE